MSDESDLKKFLQLYKSGGLNELSATEPGYRFLLLRSLARKEFLAAIARDLNLPADAKSGVLFQQAFGSKLTATNVEAIIRSLDKVDRAARQEGRDNLIAELFKLRVFDWGGIHENDINKHIVNNYIKKITNYDDLASKIDGEILESLRGFVLCSWYNNWTSIIIEDIFRNHPRVLPTVGKIKQVDFFIDRIPFDLKVTYFPSGYMEERRAQRGIVRSEVAELKRTCRQLGIPLDSSRSDQDLLLDLLSAMSESSDIEVQKAHAQFMERRRAIITDTIREPRGLLKWLYEKQGIQRFDTSNRLFLIVIDQAKLEDSWKLKRDYPLLRRSIEEYLSSRQFIKEQLSVSWEVDGSQYQSYADVLFILK